MTRYKERLKMNLIQLFAWVFVTLLISVTSHEGFCATNYFLVGEHVSNRQDSFILPLTRPENIAEARQNLELPREQRRSVAVSVVQGADGVNRNYLSPGAPLWNWHVVEFEQFFDNFAGNPPTPSSLDDETWSGPKSAGFLGYVVLEEFSLPVAVSASLQSEGIELSWNDFGANYRYTVERSDSLEEGTWRPIEGYQWPINGTTWSFNSGGESAGFFRVRAELE